MPEYDATAVDATAGPGATAVLHGMLSTLTEVLDGLDRRLAGMEAAMEGTRLEPLIERVARLEERLDDRLAEVAGGRERTAEALATIGSGVGHLAARLDQLAEVDDEPEPQPEPDRIGPLAEAVQRLERAVLEVAGRIDALPVPEPAPEVDLGPVETGLERLLHTIESLPVPEPAPAIDLTSIEAAIERVGLTIEARIAALPGPAEPPPPVDLTAIEAAVDRVQRTLESLPVLEIPPMPDMPDLGPLEERLAALATSVDAVGFGVAGLTDALQQGVETEEPDVIGAVVREAEDIRAAVAGLAQVVAAVRSDVGRVADRPVEVNVDVDLDRVLAVLEEHASAVREEVGRLDTLLRGQVAEVAGRTGAITDVIGRLDGRLHEVVDGVRALQRRADAPVRLTAVNGE